MISDAQRRATRKYEMNCIKQYSIRFNKTSDADVIAKMESVDNMIDYIRTLIRKDIKSRKRKDQQ